MLLIRLNLLQHRECLRRVRGLTVCDGAYALMIIEVAFFRSGVSNIFTVAEIVASRAQKLWCIPHSKNYRAPDLCSLRPLF